jgi:hypothetical protein
MLYEIKYTSQNTSSLTDLVNSWTCNSEVRRNVNKFDIQRTVHRDIFLYNKTNEMHLFLKFIFGIELYMFRTGFLSTIRNQVLYTQQ